VDRRALIRKLDIRIEDDLLETALTHSSFANEQPAAAPGGSNERLEFLGDAILELVVARLLYRRFPEAGAGELSRLRAAVVSEDALWRVADGLELGPHLRLGRGEETSGGRRTRSVVADALEAVIGAIYLSSGLREAERFVLRYLGPAIPAPGRPLLDPKTALQEAAQASGRTVSYRTIDSSGPDHAKTFTMEALIDGAAAGRGSGRSKKEAEQAAAREVLAGPKGGPVAPGTAGGPDGLP